MAVARRAAIACAIALMSSAGALAQEKIIFEDDFNFLDFTKWKHEITAGGGGNWEFEYYSNNRSTSFVRNSTLFIKPVLTADQVGKAELLNGAQLNLWGSDPASVCTSNSDYGCSRTSAANNIINPVASARLRTAETFNFKYGRVEVSAKMPKGDWIWPAIWLLPRHEAYGVWPASGEIDICESRGNDASYPGGGRDTFGSTLHWGPFFPFDPWNQTHAEFKVPSGDLHDDFHTYGLLWNASHIITYFDDPSNAVLKVDTSSQSFWQRGGWGSNPKKLDNPWVNGGTNAPFDQEFYLVLNVAVGGTSGYFPDGVGGKPWTNQDQHAPLTFWNAQGQWGPTWTGDDVAMQVQSVKVWQ